MKRCPRCNARFDDGTSLCPHDGAALVDLPDAMVGRTLAGRYRIAQRIGVGGMGTVYRARHLLLRRDVALKLLAPELTRDPVMRERFLREAQTANMLRHPNIVEVYDVAEEGQRVFLVMELLEGGSLASRLGTGPLPLAEAVETMIPVASALTRAHGLGVVHRDIKPENVYVARTGDGGWRVKVLDFGIAHLRNEARLTAPGEIFGTPEYIAPELARGEGCVPASDLYALGVMLFELVTGTLPFDGGVQEMIEHHRVTPAPSARSRNPEVPERLERVITRLMDKNPARRFASAAALEAELHELLAELDPAVSTVRPRVAGETAQALPSLEFIDVVEVETEAPDDELGERKTVRRSSGAAPSLATWREHRASFEAAVNAAHPDGPPEWVRAALGSVTSALAKLESLEGRRRGELRDVAEKERRALAERAGLHDALTLTETEITSLREREAAEAVALKEARLEEAAAVNEVALAWNDLGSPPSNPRVVDDARAEVMEQLGQRAGRWRRARRALGEIRALVDGLGQQRATLEAKAEALRAALDEHEAEGRRRDDEGRAQAARAGRVIDELYRSVADHADALAGHLKEYPAARALITWRGQVLPKASGAA